MVLNRNRSWLALLGGCCLALVATGTAVQAQEDQDYFIPRLKPAEGLAGQGVYSKPFLYGTEGKARLGGYFDFEIINQDHKNTTTRQHRLIPFIYANVTDRISFATELELEDADTKEGSYFSAEFAFVDFQLSKSLTYRAGAILTPLGRLNLVHDSPIQDLTDRPLMHTRIIPTTLRESGMGFLGNFAPQGRDLRVGWEVYATQGFKGGSESNSLITKTDGFKNARPHLNTKNYTGGAGTAGPDVKALQDNNSNMALVGRLSVSPFVGSEFGFSGHAGNWDNENRNGYAIYALDATWQAGPLELLGEFARANLDRTAKAQATVPGHLAGWYAQAGYHLYPGFLSYLGGDSDAHLTLVARYGTEAIDNITFGTDDRERTQTTVGINYRPNASHTVFKFERQLNQEGGSLAETDDDKWLFSVATYF